MLSKRLLQVSLLGVVVVLAIVGGLGDVKGQIIATPNIEQLCRSAPALTYRKTVVYLDFGTIRNARPEWGLTILNRLELSPRESLTIIGVNPNTFEVREVFDTCLPSLATSEIEDARKSRGIWDKLTSLDPADQQRENLQTFDARLRNALDKIIDEAARYQEGRRRNVLGAIALDKNRYSDRSAFYRVIIFTDGIIKEPTDEVPPAGTAPSQSLAERYPASLSGAEVAVFGIDGNSQDATLESKELVFSSYFLEELGAPEVVFTFLAAAR